MIFNKLELRVALLLTSGWGCFSIFATFGNASGISRLTGRRLGGLAIRFTRLDPEKLGGFDGLRGRGEDERDGDGGFSKTSAASSSNKSKPWPNSIAPSN
jgi:hypothetical protein